MRQHTVTFANFICRFGDDKVLLDYASEIVLPALLDRRLMRQYGKSTRFFFYETKFIILEGNDQSPIVGVHGHFVKDSYLAREQVYDDKHGIVSDIAQLQSSPSGFFLLILNSHRLIYFSETAHAPDLQTFRATMLDFLKRKHREFINDTFDQQKTVGRKITKKRLYEIHPLPTLELIPISGNEQIENFLKRYQLLKRVQIRLVTPNHEMDGGALFSQLREHISPMNANIANLVISSKKEGLNVSASTNVIKEALDGDVHEIQVSGIDHEGYRLSGDNNSFQVEATLDTLPSTDMGLAHSLYKSFTDLASNKIIHIPSQPESVSDSISTIIENQND